MNHIKCLRQNVPHLEQPRHFQDEQPNVQGRRWFPPGEAAVLRQSWTSALSCWSSPRTLTRVYSCFIATFSGIFLPAKVLSLFLDTRMNPLEEKKYEHRLAHQIVLEFFSWKEILGILGRMSLVQTEEKTAHCITGHLIWLIYKYNIKIRRNPRKPNID